MQAVAVHDATFAVTDANARAIAEICVRLDGLPLALELAAARLRLLSPQQMAGLLDRRLDLLRSTARDDAGHHATLRATIAWSVDLLPADVRARLAVLGVFDGGFDLAAAAAVIGVDSVAALDVLDVLVENHLVRVDPAVTGGRRFDLLETIREYALTELAGAGPSPPRGTPTPTGTARSPPRQRPNSKDPIPSAPPPSSRRHRQLPRRDVVAVGRHGRGRHPWPRAHRRPVARTGGPTASSPRAALISCAPLTPRDWPPSGALAEATRRLGNLLLKSGDMDGGRRAYLHSIEVNERLGDEFGLARARSNLGNILSDIGDIDGAERLRLLALPVLDGAPGYERALASTLNGLAFVGLQRGDLDTAVTYLERCIATLRAVGDAGNLQTVLGNMAEMHAERGDFDSALAAVDEALAMAQAQHDTYETHGYSIDRAEILVCLGRLDEADATIDELFSGTDSLSAKQEAAAWCALGGFHLAASQFRRPPGRSAGRSSRPTPCSIGGSA